MRFSEIIDQDKIKDKLIQTVKDNRVSHAQLFFGGEGHGKLALAIAYSQFISCSDDEKFVRGDSCGKCLSCIKIQKLIHPDLHFVYPVSINKRITEKPKSTDFIKEWRELTIKNRYHISLNEWYKKIQIERKQGAINVYDCNEIINTLSYTSYESEYKIMIIWMVEKLNYAAAPKLLKILEEPSDKTLFILISEHTDQIIPTIISRTQLVKIPKIKDEELIEACINIHKCTRKTATNVAGIANGNYIEAVRLISEEADTRNHFTRFREWMRMCYDWKIQKIMDFSSGISKNGREQNKSFLQNSLNILRNCFIMNLSGENLLRLRDEEKTFVKKFSPFVNSQNVIRFTEEFNKAIYHIERNANAGIVFLDLSLTIVKLLRIKAEKM